MTNDIIGAMFKHSDEQFAKDVAKAKKGICPECDADLTVHDPVAHAEFHWDEFTIQHTMVSDGHRRKALILAYAKTRPKPPAPAYPSAAQQIEDMVGQAMTAKES